MKRGILAALIVAVLLAAIGGIALWMPTGEESPLVESTPQETAQEAGQEMHAVWFAFNEWRDILSANTQEEFSQNVDTILQNVKSIGCDSLILHVHVYGDAMYDSAYYPWSKYCSGTLGVSPGYDPLTIFAQKAKEQDVALHAWINPLRTTTDEEFTQMSDDYQIKQWYNAPNRADYYMKDTNGRYILNPENPEVRQLVCDSVRELETNYDIAGVHIDDYFFPTGVDTLPENDMAYYQAKNPGTDIASWRRESTSQMVQQMYQTVKEVDQSDLFGVSPQANLENDYNKMFIDVPQWVTQEGYLDYIVPQIYFGFENENLPFDTCAATWNDLVTHPSVALYAGLPAYKIGMEVDINAGTGQSEWYNCAAGPNDMLAREIQTLESLDHFDGYFLYTYASLFLPDGAQNPTTAQEVEHMKECFKN